MVRKKSLKISVKGKKGKVSKKISKIMHEGIRGKKVSQKQAVAVAYSMLGQGNKKMKKQYRKMKA